MPTPTPLLFTPIRVGKLQLSHRLVLSPLTRFRANREHVHGDLAVTYYVQRAAEPGTLLIAEGTYIAPWAGGYHNIPGIWSDQQIEAWKRVTNAVHAKGSYIYLQVMALGRVADPTVLHEEDPNIPYVSASDIPVTGQAVAPRALTIAEIKEYIQQFATAAANAVHRAGFDGVEVHANNGGSIENRSRFALEIVAAVSEQIGQERTSIRLSPWGRFADMRGSDDPKPQFSYLVRQLAARFPSLSYLSVIEPRVQASEDRIVEEGESNDFIRDIWQPTKLPLISAGGYTRDTALDAAENKGDLISFGRYWISNPDLPRRLKDNLPLAPYDRDTFYAPEDAHGYIDYPVAGEPTTLISE